MNAVEATPSFRLPSPDELLDAAYHEAGHATMCRFFGLQSREYLGGVNEGLCQHQVGDSDQGVSICWAGAVAEDLTNHRASTRTLPKVELTRETLRDWLGEMLRGGLAELSWEDRHPIEICSRPFEALVTTFEVLSENRRVLELEARSLVQQSQKRIAEGEAQGLTSREIVNAQVREDDERDLAANTRKACEEMDAAIPMAEKFPAGPAEFWDLVVGENGTLDPKEKLRRMEAYVREETRRCGGDPDNSAHQNLLVMRFHASIPTKSQWAECARSYRNWLKQENGSDSHNA